MSNLIWIISIGVIVMTFKGIYAMSGSIIISLIGTLIFGGAYASAPLFVFIGYPITELIFRDHGLSIYSAIIVGLSLLQMAIVFYTMRASRHAIYQEPLFTEWSNETDADRAKRDDEIAMKIADEWGKKEEKPESSTEMYKRIAYSVDNLHDYLMVLLDLADNFAIEYERSFEINNSDKIYDVMAIIFQSKINMDHLTAEQDNNVYTALSALLIRYSGQNPKERWESADRCREYYLDAMSRENLDNKDLSKIMFIAAGIMAKYIEPEKQKYDLIINSMTILTWDAMLTIFAKRLLEL